MRIIIHISDLHFGRINPATLSPLKDIIHRIKGDVVAISGDIAQRATKKEYAAARAFLKSIRVPLFIVPGNHDVSYRPVRRMTDPFRNYRSYISDDLEPFFCDEEIALVGINSARAWKFAGGRLGRRSTALAKKRLGTVADHVTKIIVAHHPFDTPPGVRRTKRARKARRFIMELSDCNVDLYLAGHLHRTHVTLSSSRYHQSLHTSIIVQAGTTTSVRLRNEQPSFNIVRVEHPNLTVEHFLWDPVSKTFDTASITSFVKRHREWVHIGEPEQIEYIPTQVPQLVPAYAKHVRSPFAAENDKEYAEESAR